MDKIQIENDKYALSIYISNNYLDMITFRIWKGTTSQMTINVMLPASTAPDPEKWLLELSEGEIVRDEEGRRIRLGSDQVYFDIDGEFCPILPLSYYGFTAGQLRTAIKETLAPEPEPKVEWPSYIKDGTELRYSKCWDYWYLESEDGSEIRLERFYIFADAPLLVDHLDKTKIYVKGEE